MSWNFTWTLQIDGISWYKEKSLTYSIHKVILTCLGGPFFSGHGVDKSLYKVVGLWSQQTTKHSVESVWPWSRDYSFTHLCVYVCDVSGVGVCTQVSDVSWSPAVDWVFGHCTSDWVVQALSDTAGVRSSDGTLDSETTLHRVLWYVHLPRPNWHQSSPRRHEICRGPSYCCCFMMFTISGIGPFCFIIFSLFAHIQDC